MICMYQLSNYDRVRIFSAYFGCRNISRIAQYVHRIRQKKKSVLRLQLYTGTLLDCKSEKATGTKCEESPIETSLYTNVRFEVEFRRNPGSESVQQISFFNDQGMNTRFNIPFPYSNIQQPHSQITHSVVLASLILSSAVCTEYL